MTIEESKYYVKRNFDGMMENPRLILDPRYIEAERMAIASLEAWDKVIEELRNKIDIEVFKPNKECGIYCRMYDVEMLIRKHLQEVQNNDI